MLILISSRTIHIAKSNYSIGCNNKDSKNGEWTLDNNIFMLSVSRWKA